MEEIKPNLEPSVIAEKDTLPNPSPVSQIKNNPSKKILIILLILALLLVAVASYLLGAMKKQPELVIGEPSPAPIATIEPTKAINPAILPTKVPPSTWRKETITVSDESEFGKGNVYNLEFRYPETWTVQKIEANHQNDNLGRGCVDFVIADESLQTSVSLKLICTSWQSQDYNLPKEFVVLKSEIRGVGGHTNDVIRYYSAEANTYSYSDVLVQSGTEISNSDKMIKEVLINYPKHEYFIPMTAFFSAPAGINISQESIQIADQILLSLELTEK